MKLDILTSLLHLSVFLRKLLTDSRFGLLG